MPHQTMIERDLAAALTAAPGSGPTSEVAAIVAPDEARAVITHPAPFPGMRRFLDEYGRHVAAKEPCDLLALVRHRDAQGFDALAEIECNVCGMTITAGAMLACGSCAN